MPYYIGLDLGTGSMKTVLFREDGTAVSQAEASYPLFQPHNGWSEQDPADWARAAETTIRTVMDTSGVPAEEVRGIGMSGQMMGLVLLDEKGCVLRRAILWNDGRTQDACARLRERIGDDLFMRVSCTPARPGLTAAKIEWVRENEPEIFAKAAHILLPKDYLRYHMTGEFAAEVSDASATQLLDVPKRKWSPEMAQAMEIPERMLGRVCESPEITGTLRPAFAKAAGLSERCAVAGGASDNAAAAVGTGITEPGLAMTTIGTSGTVFAYSKTPAADPNRSVYTFCMPVPGAWHYMGSVNSAGASLKWWRGTFYPDDAEYEAINADAARSVPGANRLIYLPYLNGEQSPHFDLTCRGSFVGLSAIHTKADMTRAVMEGVTFALKDILSAITAAGGEEDADSSPVRMCGGGSKSPFWRQLLADIYGRPVVLPEMDSANSAALGAAILAMTGCGEYRSVPEACRKIVRMGREIWSPHPERSLYYQSVYREFDALYPKLKDSFRSILAL